MSRRLGFSGKSGGLSVLKAIEGIKVPSYLVIDSSLTAEALSKSITNFLANNVDIKRVAVRSDAKYEDSEQASFAGIYETILNIPAELTAILKAIQSIKTHAAAKSTTVSYYAQKKGLKLDDNEIGVIVQAMLKPERSGVLFSHGLDKYDGYYLISETQGQGAAITSGLANGQLIRVARGIDPQEINLPWLSKLITAMVKIEAALKDQSLNLEFAFVEGVLYFLQCRSMDTPVATKKDRINHSADLSNLSASIAKQYEGDILGDMIDINPAELLGRKPSSLEISVFRYLLADDVVETARSELGYAPLHKGLLRNISAKPYISLRASAYSFRPAGISQSVYEKLFKCYRAAIIADPAKQNRVEFDLFAMRPGPKLERILSSANLTAAEATKVKKAFRQLEEGFVLHSKQWMQNLEGVVQSYLCDEKAHSFDNPMDFLKNARHWALLYSKVARLAFYWMNAFKEEYPDFNLEKVLSGRIRSQSSRLHSDLLAYRRKEMTREEIINKYGHIRPGQFSLFGEVYADDPDYYLFGFDPACKTMQEGEVTDLLNENRFFHYILFFMEAREEVKFYFTRALSHFASALTAWISERGISKSQAQNSTYQELFNLDFDFDLKLAPMMPAILPSVILPGMDLRIITEKSALASYVTQERVSAEVCYIGVGISHNEIAGKIVLIENADPGYDFLFHSSVAGIITQNGGPASHLCIRAIEMQTPACIGCGPHVFHQLLNARTAILDCSRGQIIVLT